MKREDEPMTLRYYTHGRRDERTVALTFDDGPNPPRTDQILDILRDKGVLATFFVLGKWVDRFPRCFMRIAQAGHAIGNHSYLHHAHLGDYDRAEAAIGEGCGKPTRFLRAHYFNFFTCLHSPVAMDSGMAIIDADVNPTDFAKTDPQAIIKATLEHPSLAPGSIIDLHDGGETDDDALRLARPLPMIQALPAIIDGLRAKNLEPVSLDRMTLVEPITWQPDERGLYASPEIRNAIGSSTRG